MRDPVDGGGGSGGDPRADLPLAGAEPSGRRRGYLTLAAGDRRYLEMAVDMVLSLREHTRLPVALATDPPLREVVASDYPRVFDQVVMVAERFRGSRALKYGCAEATPFDETVFVDADCLVLGPLDGVFDVLDRAPIAMLGERLTAADDRRHHGYSTQSLIRRHDLDAYLKTNSGIFAFRRGPALDFMEACLRCYLEELRPRYRWERLLGRWLGDEIAFGIVGGRRGVATLAPLAPMYWPDEIEHLDPEAPTKPLLHVIHAPPPHAVARLLADTERRRREAGVTGDARRHWEEEIRRRRAPGGAGRVAAWVGRGR